jgi:NADPH:quinone reductase
MSLVDSTITGTHMKRVIVSRFGGPDVLEVVEVEKPIVQAGEILVRVCAAGVNFFEVLMRQNRYAVTPKLPVSFGVEIAGIVEDAGRHATLRPGSRVAVPLFAFGRDGGYSEYVEVDAAAAVPLPDAVSFEVGVALLVQGLTALYAVRRTSLRDKTVLVTAAGGGVGTLLIQLAKRAGARRVIAAAGSQEKLNLAQSLGADAAVNYSKNGWEGECLKIADRTGVDIAFDFVGGDLTPSILGAMAPCGHLVFGALGRFTLDNASLSGMFERNQSIQGFALLPLLNLENLRSDIEELFGLASQGRLKAIIGGRFALDAVADAHRVIEARGSLGKFVLVPSGTQ